LSKYEYVAANFAESCAWGGWLRAAETFSLDDEDVEIITQLTEHSTIYLLG
jgi:hypothetical protein